MVVSCHRVSRLTVAYVISAQVAQLTFIRYAVMLCFDVKVDKEAQAYADEVGVKLFTAEIIYHLFDVFTAYKKVQFTSLSVKNY